jgi:hypothetical protein
VGIEKGREHRLIEALLAGDGVGVNVNVGVGVGVGVNLGKDVGLGVINMS